MAVDSRNRRASCIGIGLPFARVRPLADGSLADGADRRQLTFCYSGLATGAASTFEIAGIHLYLRMRQRLDLATIMPQRLDLTLEMRDELNNEDVFLGGLDQ